MRSKKWASFFVFALILMNGSIVQAHEIIPTLSIAIGQFDQDIVDPNWSFVNVSDSGPLDQALDVRGEYRFGSCLYCSQDGAIQLKPFAGIEATSDGSFFGLGGVVLDVYLGPIVLTPSFGPGIYLHGRGKDLGYPLEFRSQLELGYEFVNAMRISAAYSHISNAGLGSSNPGANIVGLYMHFPIP
jgi:lipid A 3-O-deacylase